MTDKYLFLDDGLNVKAYLIDTKRYDTVCQYPPTKEDFINFGNDRIYPREGLVVENPTVLIYSETEKNIKLKSSVIPINEIVELKKGQNIAGEGIKNIQVDYDIHGESSIKIAFSNDDGQTYKAYKNNAWVSVKKEKEALEVNGMDISEVSSLSSSVLASMFKKESVLKFMFILIQENSLEKCKLSHLKINYIA